MAATFTSLQETFRKVGEQRAAEVLQGQAYNHLKIKEHINSICDAVLVDLRELCPDFKYSVTTTILQKSGAGVTSHATCFWDPSTDGCVTATFETKQLLATVTIFAVSV